MYFDCSANVQRLYSPEHLLSHSQLLVSSLWYGRMSYVLSNFKVICPPKNPQFYTWSSFWLAKQTIISVNCSGGRVGMMIFVDQFACWMKSTSNWMGSFVTRGQHLSWQALGVQRYKVNTGLYKCIKTCKPGFVIFKFSVIVNATLDVVCNRM